MAEPSPSAPAPSEPAPAEPVASEPPAPSESASPASAPGVDTGVYVDPATGSVRVDENTGLALAVAAWLAALVAGLTTAYVVVP